MPFDWGEFLNLARKLLKSKEESVLRTSVSRAYYSAFHRAMDFGEVYCDFIRRNDGDDHRNIRKSLDTNFRSMSLSLGRLYDNRRQADYKPIIKNPASLAEISVIEAENLINELGKQAAKK